MYCTWSRCTVPELDVLYLNSMYCTWYRCTAPDLDVLHLIALYCTWFRCTAPDLDALHLISMYCIWSRCTAPDLDVLHLISMYCTWSLCMYCTWSRCAPCRWSSPRTWDWSPWTTRRMLSASSHPPPAYTHSLNSWFTRFSTCKSLTLTHMYTKRVLQIWIQRKCLLKKRFFNFTVRHWWNIGFKRVFAKYCRVDILHRKATW